jgi:fructose-1,6-bisphosphatase/inositol monophosphatase family enzyme
MGAIDLCYFTYLKCWDVAAGILILQESGGIVLDSNGKFFFFLIFLKL